MGSSQRLREQAARAREYAQQARMQADRDAWLAIAERWEHLAKIAEEAASEDRAEAQSISSNSNSHQKEMMTAIKGRLQPVAQSQSAPEFPAEE